MLKCYDANKSMTPDTNTGNESSKIVFETIKKMYETKNAKIMEPAEYEDADDGAQGEDKEELVPRLLVKDVGKG